MRGSSRQTRGRTGSWRGAGGGQIGGRQKHDQRRKVPSPRSETLDSTQLYGSLFHSSRNCFCCPCLRSICPLPPQRPCHRLPTAAARAAPHIENSPSRCPRWVLPLPPSGCVLPCLQPHRRKANATLIGMETSARWTVGESSFKLSCCEPCAR